MLCAALQGSTTEDGLLADIVAVTSSSYMRCWCYRSDDAAGRHGHMEPSNRDHGQPHHGGQPHQVMNKFSFTGTVVLSSECGNVLLFQEVVIAFIRGILEPKSV